MHTHTRVYRDDTVLSTVNRTTYVCGSHKNQYRQCDIIQKQNINLL